MAERSLNTIPAGSRQSGGFVNSVVKSGAGVGRSLLIPCGEKTLEESGCLIFARLLLKWRWANICKLQIPQDITRFPCPSIQIENQKSSEKKTPKIYALGFVKEMNPSCLTFLYRYFVVN